MSDAGAAAGLCYPGYIPYGEFMLESWEIAPMYCQESSVLTLIPDSSSCFSSSWDPSYSFSPAPTTVLEALSLCTQTYNSPFFHLFSADCICPIPAFSTEPVSANTFCGQTTKDWGIQIQPFILLNWSNSCFFEQGCLHCTHACDHKHTHMPQVHLECSLWTRHKALSLWRACATHPASLIIC